MKLLILIIATFFLQACSHAPMKNCEEREGIFFNCEDI